MFNNYEEANQKLRHSVVLYQHDPVFVSAAEGKGARVLLHVNPLAKLDSTMIQDIFDKNWNFRDLGSYLGYVNYEGSKYNQALYLSRMPVRQCSSTQGVSQRNLYIPNLVGSSRLGLPDTSIGWDSVFPCPGFSDMFKLLYPNLQDIGVLFTKNNNVTSKAFTREFAVRKSDVGPMYLQYKGRDIGHSDDLYRWKIADQFKHLRETLDHINLKVI